MICSCGGTIRVLDTARQGETLGCDQCQRCMSVATLLRCADELNSQLAVAEAKVARLYARGADTTSALRDERDFTRAFGAMAVELDHDYDRALSVLARLYNATAAYFEHNSAEHEDYGCPEDDTCTCPLVNAVNEAFAAALPIVEGLGSAHQERKDPAT